MIVNAPIFFLCENWEDFLNGLMFTVISKDLIHLFLLFSFS